MDTTKAITHVSLCAGYGGIDLGLKRAIPSLRTIAFSEIEAFACANLVSKMEAGLLDPAPIWTDLKTFPWSEFHGRVDILSGGYPCQPFSAAGKRLGAEDPRHLWPFIAAGIAAMRPGACFFENVEGHCSLGLPDVLQDLAGMGYRTTWGVFSASEVGAPHQRKRIFILAHDQRQRVKELGWQIAGASQFNSAWNDGGDAILADTERTSLTGRRVAGDMAQAQGSDEGQGLQRQRMRDAADHCGATPWPSRPGQQQFAWEPPRVVANGQRTGWSTERVIGHLGGAQSEKGGAGHQPASPTANCGGAGAEEAMGNAQKLWRTGFCEDNSPNLDKQFAEPTDTGCDAGLDNAEGIGWQESGDFAGYSSQPSSRRQAQPSLGRDADGLTHRLDDAVLHVTTDNRTDELRLLGNGVVPATAERAFRVLVGELMEEQR